MSKAFCVKNPSKKFLDKVNKVLEKNGIKQFVESPILMSFNGYFLRIGPHPQSGGILDYGLLGYQTPPYKDSDFIPERLEKNVRTRCIERALGIVKVAPVKVAPANKTEPAFIWEPSPELLKKLGKGKGEEKIEAKSWLYSITIGDGVGKSHYTYPLKIENGGDLSIQNIYDAICDTFKVKNSDRG